MLTAAVSSSSPSAAKVKPVKTPGEARAEVPLSSAICRKFKCRCRAPDSTMIFSRCRFSRDPRERSSAAIRREAPSYSSRGVPASRHSKAMVNCWPALTLAARLKGRSISLVIDGELAVRIAGQLASREGYTRDVNTGVEYDNRHFQAARIGILFQPTNAIENYFIGNYLAFNEHGPGTSVIAGNPNNPFIGTGILDYVTAQQARATRRTALTVTELDQGVFSTLINKTSSP